MLCALACSLHRDVAALRKAAVGSVDLAFDRILCVSMGGPGWRSGFSNVAIRRCEAHNVGQTC